MLQELSRKFDAPLSINQVSLVVGTVPERAQIKKNSVRSSFLDFLRGSPANTLNEWFPGRGETIESHHDKFAVFKQIAEWNDEFYLSEQDEVRYSLQNFFEYVHKQRAAQILHKQVPFLLQSCCNNSILQLALEKLFGFPQAHYKNQSSYD